MQYVFINGSFAEQSALVFPATNKSFRFGDGLFETMQLRNGLVLLASFHFDRFFSSMTALQFQVAQLPDREKLLTEVKALCQKNNCEKRARIRLSAWRGEGALTDDTNQPGYIIECWPLAAAPLLPATIAIDLFTAIKKNIDRFANIKSANFLPYTMATLYAKERQVDDCVLLNSNGDIADSTISNIFLYKNDVFITPSIDQGCVQGVMRRYLIEKMKASHYSVEERSVAPEELLTADEVFLTNAITGIRSVKCYGDTFFETKRSAELYQQLIFPLFTNGE